MGLDDERTEFEAACTFLIRGRRATSPSDRTSRRLRQSRSAQSSTLAAEV